MASAQIIDDILSVDWEQVRFRRAVSGVVVIVLVAGLVGLTGDIIMTATLASLFVVATGGDGSMSVRLPGMVRFTIAGAVLGGLAYWSSESAFSVALVLGGATYLGTLAAAFGPSSARRGLFLTLWAMFALLLGSGDTEPLAASIAFLVGGAFAIAVTAIRLAFSVEDDAGEADEPEDADAVEGEGVFRPQRVAKAIFSPIGLFAVLRAVAVAFAVVLGFWWFSSYPLWTAITVIVVVKPSAGQTASIVVQRTLGTAVGAVIAMTVAQVLPRGETGVVIALLVSAFFMVAFLSANYTLFATFLTAMLLFGLRLVQGDAFEAGWERLLATVVGAGIALLVVVVALGYRRVSPPATT